MIIGNPQFLKLSKAGLSSINVVPKLPVKCWVWGLPQGKVSKDKSHTRAWVALGKYCRRRRPHGNDKKVEFVTFFEFVA